MKDLEDEIIDFCISSFKEDPNLSRSVKDVLGSGDCQLWNDTGECGESYHSFRCLVKGIVKGLKVKGLLVPPGTMVCIPSFLYTQVNFDETGLGLPDRPYAGWVVCNGNNGTRLMISDISDTILIMKVL
ncbi:MAG: hypothetical protein MJA83_16720 [Gammaproteobacteria bacterium]|nr:hypothetical protein [Gammaproteobacteria bacterium]